MGPSTAKKKKKKKNSLQHRIRVTTRFHLQCYSLGQHPWKLTTPPPIPKNVFDGVKAVSTCGPAENLPTATKWPNPLTQRLSRHPFVCAVCHSKPRVFWMEIRRSRMSAFLTSYAHAFCTVTWRDLVLHVRKNRKRRSLLYRELYPFQKFAIPLENLQFHWSMYPYERGSVSTVVCHLFVVQVPERSAVCSQALCAVSGEA